MYRGRVVCSSNSVIALVLRVVSMLKSYTFIMIHHTEIYQQQSSQRYLRMHIPVKGFL